MTRQKRMSRRPPSKHTQRRLEKMNVNNRDLQQAIVKSKPRPKKDKPRK